MRADGHTLRAAVADLDELAQQKPVVIWAWSCKQAVVPVITGPRAVFDSSVYILLPRPSERCPVSGLSRSTLAELVRPCERNDYRPPVESRLLKRKGASRGVLLISRQSLLDYINVQPIPTRADIADATDEALADEARAGTKEGAARQ